MLIQEPILLLITLYMAFIYGILYLFFESYPISFIQERGWNLGVGGSAGDTVRRVLARIGGARLVLSERMRTVLEHHYARTSVPALIETPFRTSC